MTTVSHMKNHQIIVSAVNTKSSTLVTNMKAIIIDTQAQTTTNRTMAAKYVAKMTMITILDKLMKSTLNNSATLVREDAVQNSMDSNTLDSTLALL